MENYDLLMLGILGIATVFGAIKGFAWQLASIASITVSYVVAYQFRDPVAETIRADPPWNKFLAMLILYLGTSLVIWVAFRAISRSIDNWKLNSFDRQVGAAFGFVKGVLYCTLATLFAVSLLGPELRGQIVSSRSGYYISMLLDEAGPVIPEEWDGIIRPYLDRFDRAFQETGGYANDAGGAGWGDAGGSVLGGQQPWPIAPEGALPSSLGDGFSAPLPRDLAAEAGGGFQLPESVDLKPLLPAELFHQAQDLSDAASPRPLR